MIANLDRATGRVDVLLGNERLCRTRQPLFDGARALRDRGYPDKTVVQILWRGSKFHSMSARIGVAAGLRVIDSDRDGMRFGKFTAMDDFMQRKEKT